MPRIALEDPDFSELFVNLVAHWIAGTIRFQKPAFGSLTIVVGLRRALKGRGLGAAATDTKSAP